MYSLLLALIYLSFISLGLPDSLIGAGWPIMHIEMGVSLSYMGIVTMIIAGGTVVSSLLSERLTKKLGTKYVTLISVFLTAAALLGFSTASKFWMLCIWAIPYGLGAGAIDAALNNYVALYYTSRHMNWLHSFWGVGAIISPYIMSYAISNSIWNNGYRYVSYIQFSIVIVMILTLPLWRVNQKRSLSAESGKVGISNALRIKGVPYLLLGFFAYCAAESTTMNWASSYFVEARGIPEKTAAAYASLFYIGLTFGRFIAGFVSDKFGDRNMIRLGTTILACGLVCIMLPVKLDIISIAGFVVVGLGCAPIYPCIIHSTPFNFGAENSQAIIGIQMASAYAGSTFIPPLFGLFAQNISLKLLPFYCLIFFTLMIVMTEKTFKKTQKKSAVTV